MKLIYHEVSAIVSAGGRQQGGDGLLLEHRRRWPLADAGYSLEESGSTEERAASTCTSERRH
jgi:hypothetical protein